MVDCNMCLHLNLTEKEQDKIKKETGKYPDHKCTKYKKRVFHFEIHPKLVPCVECNGKGFDFE